MILPLPLGYESDKFLQKQNNFMGFVSQFLIINPTNSMNIARILKKEILWNTINAKRLRFKKVNQRITISYVSNKSKSYKYMV